MARKNDFITDEMWEVLEPLLPETKSSPKGGRPWRSNRECLEGILWILWTGAPWRALPEKFPSPATCWRRLAKWEEQDVLLEVWREFLKRLDDKEKIKWDETFADGTFIPAKKGAQQSEKQKAGRDRSSWQWSMVRVFRWEFSLPLHRLRRLS